VFVTSHTTTGFGIVVSTSGKVGIGTSSPDEKLHIAGSIKIVDGTQQYGFVLTSNADGKGTWLAGGNVSGPASSTDHAIVRFNGTDGKTIQNSSVTIDDTNNLYTPGTGTFGIGRFTTGIYDNAGTPLLDIDVGNRKLYASDGSTVQVDYSTANAISMGGAGTPVGNSNFFGNYAGNGATDASYSNFFGYYTGYDAIYASNSNFFGTGAGNGATDASYSNFFGYNAGNGATSASNSNFFGYGAGNSATSASESIFIGSYAGYCDTVDNTSNSGTSIAIGKYSGTGGYSDSVAIGHGVKNSAQYEMNFGNVMKLTGIYASDTPSSSFVTGATVNLGSNALTTTGNVGIGIQSPQGKLHILSNSTTDPYVFVTSHTTSGFGIVVSTGGKVGIGTSSPDEKLHIAGSIKIVDGSQYSGYVLKCDASGKGTWQQAASGDVSGPASSTDHGIVRFDGTTGKTIQNSSATIDDTNNLTTTGTGTFGAGAILGIDAATNTAGTIKFWSAGANNYYSTVTAGTQTANATYTLPTAMATANSQALLGSTAGVLSWGTNFGANDITTTNTVSGSILNATSYVQIKDPSSTYSLLLKPSGTAFGTYRSLYFNVANADRTITFSGNPTLDDWFNQAVKTTSSPSFVNLTTTGTVGIGIQSPQGKLHILSDSTTNPYVFVTSHTTSGFGIVVSTGGKVGIGMTGPNQKLSVAGTFGILEGGSTPTKYTIFQGGDQSVDITYTLPTAYTPVTGYVLSSSTAGVLSWATSGGMVYPGEGIAVSAGSYWGTSISDNHNNWDSAYSIAYGLNALNSLSGILVGSSGYYSTITDNHSNWDSVYSTWGGVSNNSSNWDTAYSWVNSYGGNSNNWNDAYSWVSSNHYNWDNAYSWVNSYGSGYYNWDTAYGWGNHANAGYLTSQYGGTSDTYDDGTDHTITFSNGHAQSISTAFDKALMKNIATIDSVLPYIDEIKPSAFEWNEEGLKQFKIPKTGTQLGFVAQDLQAHFPELVVEKKGKITYDKNELQVIMLKAIQELKAENEALKSQIKTLESKIQ
jgi:hypothetical protein